MADDEVPEVDPRFDPVFQRGYDPAVHAAPVRRSVLRAPAVKPAPLPVAPTAAEVPPVVGVEHEDQDELEDEPHRRNPWLLALVLVSTAFLAAAGVFLWVIGQRDIYSFSGTPAAAELMVQQLSYMLPPALIVAGVLGLVLRVALGALRGRA